MHTNEPLFLLDPHVYRYMRLWAQYYKECHIHGKVHSEACEVARESEMKHCTKP